MIERNAIKSQFVSRNFSKQTIFCRDARGILKPICGLLKFDPTWNYASNFEYIFLSHCFMLLSHVC